MYVMKIMSVSLQHFQCVSNDGKYIRVINWMNDESNLSAMMTNVYGGLIIEDGTLLENIRWLWTHGLHERLLSLFLIQLEIHVPERYFEYWLKYPLLVRRSVLEPTRRQRLVMHEHIMTPCMWQVSLLDMLYFIRNSLYTDKQVTWSTWYLNGFMSMVQIWSKTCADVFISQYLAQPVEQHNAQ